MRIGSLQNWASPLLLCLGACNPKPHTSAVTSQNTSSTSIPRQQTAAAPAPGDLHGLTLRELEIEAALPLAKHGRVFRTRWLDEYFRGQAWYRPTGFDANALSGEERERVEAVRHFVASLTPEELAKREESLRRAGQQAVRQCPYALSTGGGKGSVPERLAVQYASGELVLWDLASHVRRWVDANGDLDGYGEPTFADDGQRLLAFIADEKHVFPLIVAWDTQTLARLPFDPNWREMEWADYLFATRGLYATTRTPQSRLWKVYGLQDGRHVLDLPSPGNGVHLNKLVLSNDLRAAVGRGVTYNAHWVWDLSAKKPGTPKPLWTGEEGVRDVDLTPDGKLIATLPQYSYSVTFLSAHDRTLQRKIDLQFEPRYVRFSEDGHLILVGGEKHLVVVEVATGNLLRSRGWGDRCLYRAHQRATFLGDSRHLAIAGDAGGLSIVGLYGGGEVELSPDAPPLDTETARLETALLQRARGSDGWKSEPRLSDLPLGSHPELFEQSLSVAEVRAEVGNDPWKLNPIAALIYARRGRVFKSPHFKSFSEHPWYHPDPGYTDAKLTAVDRANLEVLSRVRESIDRRGPRAPADPASLVATKAFPGCPAGAALRRSTDERGIETYACELPSSASKTGRMPHGPTWRWLPTGRLLEQRNYDNGLEQGPFVVWFWTGARREDGEFVRGLRQGPHRTFYVTGILEEAALYDHGRLHGRRQRNFANGKRSLEATYRNGAPNGPWTTSYDNGERAIHLAFSDGKTIGTVERFALDGKPWSAGVLHEPRETGGVEELEHLDLESLPPTSPEPCREGVVGAPGAWPRSVMGPLVVASRKAFGDVSMCSPVKCADRLSIACAPDLDGNPGGEVIAVIACRVRSIVDCPGCTPPNVMYTDVAANVVFSPPTPAHPIWTQRGFVSCRRAGDLEGDPESKVQDYVRLPDGEVAIVTLDSAASSDDGRDRCSLTLHGLREGKWQTLASSNSAPCDGEVQEVEEFDVY